MGVAVLPVRTWRANRLRDDLAGRLGVAFREAAVAVPPGIDAGTAKVFTNVLEACGLEAAEAKVLCDIDDTVVCALHDRRYPRGTIYPGILALLDALDRGPGDEPFSMGDLTFVTARPGDAFGMIENYTRASLRRAGIAQHSVLTGTVQAMFTLDLMAGRKIANVQHYHALFP